MSLASKWFLKRTTNHLKAYGRRVYPVHQHISRGSSGRCPNATWKWDTINGTNAIVDALCRVCCMESPDEGQRIPLLEVDAITHTLPAGPAKLDEIQNYTNQDIILSHLKDVIQEGWSEYPIECPANLKEFWNFREDLRVENCLILKGHCLLISSNLCNHILQIIHQGHLGAEQFNLKAKDCLLAGYLKGY